MSVIKTEARITQISGRNRSSDPDRHRHRDRGRDRNHDHNHHHDGRRCNNEHYGRRDYNDCRIGHYRDQSRYSDEDISEFTMDDESWTTVQRRRRKYH